MKLWAYWRSSCSWRVRLALELKGLAYEAIAVHLIREGGEQHAESFARQSPLRQVPVLEVEHAGRTALLTQSVAILEYLEEAHPEPALLPKCPVERAHVRSMVECVNSGIQPLQNLHVLQQIEQLGQDKKAWAVHFLERGLTALEALAARSAGVYLAGEQVTLADVCSIPQLYNARRFGLDLARYPTLVAAERVCESLPPFQRAHANAQADAERS